MDEWILQRRNRKGVNNTKQRLRDHIEPAIGDIELRRLTYADLRGLRARLDGTMAPQTVHHTLADVRCLLRYAVDAGEIPSVPWRRDLMPRIAEQAPKRLTDAQMERIFRFARPKEALCIQLAVETGIRWNELRTLQWRHVLEDPWPHLLLENTKSGRVRRVPLTAGAREAIDGLRRITQSVFVSPYRMTNPCSIAYRIRDRMPKENRVRWHWHQLRHTFASRYVERGGNLVALQRLLGHTTNRMTERYANFSDAAIFADVERLERAQAATRAAGVHKKVKTAHPALAPETGGTGHDPGPISGPANTTTHGFDA